MIGALLPIGIDFQTAKAFSVWEYNSILTGWNEANKPPEERDKPAAPSAEEHRRRMADMATLLQKEAEQAPREKGASL